MVDITKAVPGPTVDNVATTMFELWSKHENDSRTQLPVFETLGSGSDYTSFLQVRIVYKTMMCAGLICDTCQHVKVSLLTNLFSADWCS